MEDPASTDPVGDLIESYVTTIGRRESAINENLRTLRELEAQVAEKLQKLETQNHDREMALAVQSMNL